MNEQETCVLQRRSIRFAAALPKGTVLSRASLSVLRPCPEGAIPPYRIDELLTRRLAKPVDAGDVVQWTDLE